MPSIDRNSTHPLAESSSHVSQSSNTRKRAASDAESRDPKKLRPDLTFDSPNLPSSSKDKKKRRKKKRKSSIVSVPQNQQHRQRSASVVPLPRHTSQEDFMTLLPMDDSADLAVEQLESSNAVNGPLAGTSDNSNSPRQDKGKAKALSPPPTVDEGVLEARIASLTQQLESRSNLLEQHQSIFQSFQQSLTCQICLDFLHKPYALAPCGHIACYNCLITWFTNMPTNGPQPRSHIFRRKTCPVCRAVVTERPAEVWTIKSMVGTLVRSGLATLPTFDDPALPASTSAMTENKNVAATDVDSATTVGNENVNARQPSASRNSLGNNDPWDGVFRAVHRTHYYPALPPLPAGAPNGHVNPGGVEHMGMLDEEDGVYRCIDCLHEIWDGVCSHCERVYSGHTLGMPLMGIDDLEDDDDDESYPDLGHWHDTLTEALRRHLENHENQEVEDDEDDDDDDDEPDPVGSAWMADAQVVDEDILDDDDEDTDMDSFIVNTDEEDEPGLIVDDDADDDEEVESIASRWRAAQRGLRRTSSEEETAPEESNEDLLATIRTRRIARFGLGEGSFLNTTSAAESSMAVPTITANRTRDGIRGNRSSQSRRRSRTNRTVPTIILDSDDEEVDLNDQPGPSNRGSDRFRGRRYNHQESDDEDSDEDSVHGAFSSYDEDAVEPYPWEKEDRAHELQVLGQEGYEDLQRRRRLYHAALEQHQAEARNRRRADGSFEALNAEAHDHLERELEIARRFRLTRDQQHPELRRREDERRDRVRNMLRIVQGPTLVEWAAQREREASASADPGRGASAANVAGPSTSARRVVSLDAEEEESEDETSQPTRRIAQNRRVVVLDEDDTEPEENNREYDRMADLEYAVFGGTSESEDDDDDDHYRTASPPRNRLQRPQNTNSIN